MEEKMNKYQITEYGDWFTQKEVIKIIKKMKIASRITITRLDQSFKDLVEKENEKC